MKRNVIKDNCADEAMESAVKNLPAAALRALAEAEMRRQQQHQAAKVNEIGGRGGHDPARYGDWEVKGRAIDF